MQGGKKKGSTKVPFLVWGETTLNPPPGRGSRVRCMGKERRGTLTKRGFQVKSRKGRKIRGGEVMRYMESSHYNREVSKNDTEPKERPAKEGDASDGIAPGQKGRLR